MARTKSEAINIVSKKPAKSRSPSPSRTSEHSTPRSNSRSKSPEQSKVTSKDGKKRAKKTSRHFHTYNYRVLKQVHPDSGLNGHAAQILDSMMQNLARRLSDTALLVAHNNNSKTVTSRDVQTAVVLELSRNLTKYAKSQGTIAVTKYNNSKGEKKSKAERSGLIFPPSLATKFLRKYGASGMRVGQGAPIYLAAVLEFLASDFLEVAGNSARDNKRVRIQPRDIFLAMNDEDLKKLNLIIPEGGVVAHIEEKLLPDKNKKKKSTKGGVVIAKAPFMRHVKEVSVSPSKLPPGTKAPFMRHVKEALVSPSKLPPGTKSLREIKRLQKETDTVIAKAPFMRHVKSALAAVNDRTSRVSDGYVTNLQYYVEHEINKLLRNAVDFMIHAGRKTLEPQDVELAIKITPNIEKIEGEPLFEYPLPKIGKESTGKHPLGSSVLKRLAQKAGAKTISGDSYLNIRNAIYYLIFTIVRDSNAIMIHNRKSTLTLDAFKEVMQLRNINVVTFNP
jgi:histone H2A